MWPEEEDRIGGVSMRQFPVFSKLSRPAGWRKSWIIEGGKSRAKNAEWRHKVTAAINSKGIVSGDGWSPLSPLILATNILKNTSTSACPPAVGVRQKSYLLVVIVGGRFFAYEMRAVNCICALLRYTNAKRTGVAYIQPPNPTTHPPQTHTSTCHMPHTNIYICLYVYVFWWFRLPAIGCRSNVDLIDFSVSVGNVFCRYDNDNRTATATARTKAGRGLKSWNPPTSHHPPDHPPPTTHWYTHKIIPCIRFSG